MIELNAGHPETAPWHPEACAHIHRLPQAERGQAWEHYKHMEYLINFGSVLWRHLRFILFSLAAAAIGGLVIHLWITIIFTPLFVVTFIGGKLLIRWDPNRWLTTILVYRLDDRQCAISDRIMELDPDIGPRVRAELDK